MAESPKYIRKIKAKVSLTAAPAISVEVDCFD
jgi:hypothetical protein